MRQAMNACHLIERPLVRRRECLHNEESRQEHIPPHVRSIQDFLCHLAASRLERVWVEKVQQVLTHYGLRHIHHLISSSSSTTDLAGQLISVHDGVTASSLAPFPPPLRSAGPIPSSLKDLRLLNLYSMREAPQSLWQFPLRTHPFLFLLHQLLIAIFITITNSRELGWNEMVLERQERERA
ncbi:hypothetical protein GOP47_0020412, partial [Adiantum capillus-veneris]